MDDSVGVISHEGICGYALSSHCFVTKIAIKLPHLQYCIVTGSNGRGYSIIVA